MKVKTGIRFVVADATVAEVRLMAMLCMFKLIVYLISK